MLSSSTVRWGHGITAGVAATALVLQFVLVWQGQAVLDETAVPTRGTRVARYFCYFTILSNFLVALTAARLALGEPLGRTWRVLRVNAVTGIAVTGVIHWFLLRPLLDLTGWNVVADTLLHVVVPVLAVLGWVVLGPRLVLDPRELALTAIFPAIYLVATLAHGAATGWYPYPFIDVGQLGYGHTLVNAAGVVLLLVALSAGVWGVEQRRRDATPAQDRIR